MSDLDLLPEHETKVRHPRMLAMAEAPRRALLAAGRFLRSEPWRSAAIGAVVLGILGVTYWAITPRTYRSHAVVAPASRSDLGHLPGALGGIAGQLGLASSLDDPTTTPAFYALLGHSESLEREVLFSALPPRAGERHGPFVWQALGIPPCDSICLVRTGLKRLDHAVDISVDRQTGTFEIGAVLRDPVNAAAVVNLYIEAIERFNHTVRRSQKRAARVFLEERVEAVTNELHADENELQAFYERNRDWQRSPRLVFDEGRLRRAVDTQTELRANLVRQLEMARLDEVNSTPLLSVIDSATPPARKYAPHGLPILLGTLITGGLLGLAVGVARIRPTDG